MVLYVMKFGTMIVGKPVISVTCNALDFGISGVLLLTWEEITPTQINFMRLCDYRRLEVSDILRFLVNFVQLTMNIVCVVTHEGFFM